MLSAVLDVAIGIVLLFLILSAAASAISEYFSSALKWRSNDLKAFLEHAFADPTVTKAFLEPFLQTKGHPDYIATEDFVTGVLRMASTMTTSTSGVASTSTLTIEQLKAFTNALPKGALKSALTSILATGETDITQISAKLTKWYDNSMDTLSSWYKKHLNRVLLLIGLVFAFGFNIDTIAYANRLFESPALRGAIAANAPTTGQQVGTSTSTSAVATVQQLQGQLQMLDLPIGWTAANMASQPDISKDLPGVVSWWLIKILGLLITGFAVSQGAPFWFDLLNRITNLRSANKPESPAVVATTTTSTTVAQPPATTTTDTVSQSEVKAAG